MNIWIDFAKIMMAKLCADVLHYEINYHMIVSSVRWMDDGTNGWMDGQIMLELACIADVYACRGSKGTGDIIITKISCAMPSSNMIRPRERREEIIGQLATHSAPRVPWSNHSALVPENPQTHAAKIRNALRKKVDPSIKRSPQAAKLRENVKVSPQYCVIRLQIWF
jgi:hypothetical protein